MRTDSTPLGKFAETFEAMIWDSHPYGWPTVGWPSDIPAITKAQADEFYGLYYAPQNISLVLVGDFKSADVTNLTAQYFGRIQKGKSEAPEVITWEIEQPAEKRMYGEAEANPQVDIVWHTVPFGHGDSYGLSLLAQVLSTRTGRLYKGLVLGSKVATDSSASPNHQKWAGTFGVSGEAAEGHTPEEVERAIYQELDRLKNEDVPPEELQKVKNNFAAYEYRRLTSNMSILMQLIFNDGLGNWREINEAGPKQQAVTAADIKRVAKKYLTKENRNVAIYTRKNGASKETAAK
jgi:predicted Zn-dependent peptidase